MRRVINDHFIANVHDGETVKICENRPASDAITTNFLDHVTEEGIIVCLRELQP